MWQAAAQLILQNRPRISLKFVIHLGNLSVHHYKNAPHQQHKSEFKLLSKSEQAKKKLKLLNLKLKDSPLP